MAHHVNDNKSTCSKLQVNEVMVPSFGGDRNTGRYWGNRGAGPINDISQPWETTTSTCSPADEGLGMRNLAMQPAMRPCRNGQGPPFRTRKMVHLTVVWCMPLWCATLHWRTPHRCRLTTWWHPQLLRIIPPHWLRTQPIQAGLLLEDRHYNHVIARFFSNSRFLIFWNLENVDLHSRMRLSL